MRHGNSKTNRFGGIPNGIFGWPRLLTEELASAYLSLPPATFREGADAGTFPAPLVIAEERLWDRTALDRAIDALSWTEQQRPRIEKREITKERVAEARRPVSTPDASNAGGEGAPVTPVPLPAVSVPAPSPSAALPPAPREPPNHLRRIQASAYLRAKHNVPCTGDTLTRLAMTGKGPVFDKVGRVPYYRPEDLDAWAAERRAGKVRLTSEPPSVKPPMSYDQSPRLRREDASAYLLEKYGISRTVATLAKLATVGGGPIFQKDGRFPLYRQKDLDAWAVTQLSGPVHSTSELPRSRTAGSSPDTSTDPATHEE